MVQRSTLFCGSALNITNTFASFVIEKVKRTRDSLDLHVHGSSHDVNVLSSLQPTGETNVFVYSQIVMGQEGDPCSDVIRLSDRRPVAEDEVVNVLKKLLNKSCLRDPVLTWLLEKHLSSLVPFLLSL